MPTNAAMIATNTDRWSKAQITRSGFDPVAQRLDAPTAKTRYQVVSAKTTVRWQAIAVTPAIAVPVVWH